MQARLLLCLALLFSVFQAIAQNDSPYARFGYEGKVLRTPQERQQRLMLLVPNTDTSSAVAQVGLDPANQRYYLFDKQNQVLKTDILAATAIARFLSVDPLATQYPWYTPYQFAGNKPIQFVDIDGLEEGYDIRLRQMERGYLRGAVTAKELSQFHQSNGVAGLAGAGIVGTAMSGPAVWAAVLRYGAPAVSYFMTNPTAVNRATEVVVGVAAGAVGYDGSDLPGPYDDAARLVRSGGPKINIALGHDYEVIGGNIQKLLEPFSEAVNAPFHKQWKDLGLYISANDFSEVFKKVTNNVVQSGGKIHFNLEYVRDLDGFLTKFKPGTKVSPSFSMTQWELSEILSNPKLLEVTEFWHGTKAIKTSQVLKQVNKSK